jgi:acyl-CoA synthetase (NDP forming)
MSTSTLQPGRADLASFYHPRSIAVIGAHETRMPNAGNTQRLIATAEAVGAAFYPVHPRFDEVFGYRCYHSIADVPGDVDVLILQVGDPAAALREAAVKHPKFAVVFTAGYSEIGTAEAVAKERELADAAREAGVRLFGPNTNINSLELRAQLPPPKIGLVTQSGAQGRPIIQGEGLGIAFSFWATTGNEADLEAADFIEFFASDKDTRAVACYLEGLKSGQRMREAAITALEQDASIVTIKVGRSDVGQAMAASHTAHLTGADAVHDAFFEQYGITRVDDLDELLEVSAALARLNTPKTRGLVVYGMSGGTAAHLGDLSAAAGIEIPRLSDATQARLRELIPDYLVVHNPVDNGGVSLGQGSGPDQMDAVMADPALGVLMYAIPGVFPSTTPAMVDSLERARQVSDAPIIVIWSGPTTDDPSYDRLLELRLPVCRNYRNAITATKALIAKHDAEPDRAEFIKAVRALPPITGPYAGTVEQLDEAASAAWLAERGIPFVEHRAVDTVEEAVLAADTLGYPVVLKGRGAKLAHKSELGLVVVGVSSAAQLRDAARRMQEAGSDAGMEGFIVARQAEPGIELLVGIAQDPVLGPVIALGAGGVTAEATRDVSLSVLPLLPSRARQMVERLRIAPILDGWRGRPGVDKEALVDLLLKLGELAATGEVEELDINPVLARPDGLVGLDALVRVRR